MQLEQLQQTIQRKREKAKKKAKKPPKQSQFINPASQAGSQFQRPRTQPMQLQASSMQQAQFKSQTLQHKPPQVPNYSDHLPQISPRELTSQQELSRPVFQQSKSQVHQSPHRQKLRLSNNPDKDILEQLADYQVLEKVLPCFDHAAGIFVQLNSNLEFGTVSAVTGDMITIEKLSGTQINLEISQVKFLAGAYVCQLSEIDFSRMSQDFEVRQKDQDSEQLVVLIQTISQQSSTENISIHRLNALINDGSEFKLHPVVFKNSSKQLKRQQKQRLSPEPEDREDLLTYFYNSEENTERVLKFARKIQNAFGQYKSKVSRIKLTDENHKNLLYSVCHILNKTEGLQHQVGILTRVYKGMAFLRLLGTKSDQQVDQKNDFWIDLSSQVEIYADLTLGFVAQSTLCETSLFGLKIRQIKFVSQRESNSQLVHKDPIQTDDLCKVCKYVKVESIKSLVCGRCQYSYHEKCLASYQVKQATETHWLCPDCTRCVNCKAGSNDLLVCGECNVTVHLNCIDPGFKLLINTSDLKDVSEFRCEDCIKCTACGRRDPGESSQWSKDFKLCSSCDKKRDQKMFCGGCLQFLPENENEQTTELLLRCAYCTMWIHKTCDRMLEDNQILQKFQINDQSTILYACVNCRQKSRANFIEQIVDLMISEDKKNEFLYPFWQTPNNAQYLTIIKEPICFQNIKDELKNFISDLNFTSQKKVAELRYLTKPEQFRADIDRIFRNAKTFNRIKDEIHKLALRMHEKCNQILNSGRIWEIFEKNSKVTHDELQNLKFLRLQTVTPHYILKPKDLFCNNEQIDIRLYQSRLQESLPANLGKRNRDSSANQTGQKRIKIGENQDQIVADQNGDQCVKILQSDHKKIMQEANKNLLLLNLGNLLQNLQNKQLNNTRTDKNSVGQHFDDYANELQLSPKSRWRHLMEDLRSSDEKDSCWYSSPVRVSFDDPSLIFEEMCYLCGAFGLKEDFLCCNFCGESFHPYCLPCPKDSKQGLQEHWFCYNCIFCDKCHSSKEWEFLVLCAICDKADHFQCLEPQLIQVPECSWKCPDCFQCRTCGTRNFFSEENIANKVNLDPNEKYILSFDFEFCYQCGQDQYKKSFCNMCKMETGLGLRPQVCKKNFYAQVELTTQAQCENQNLYKCVKCNFYSHLECSRTSPESLRYLQQQPEFTGYQCLDCLLVDKQPGYYLHEQCMLYGDLHDRLMAFQNLKLICDQILQKYTSDQLILNEYVRQNQLWLETDPLIQKWIQLLRTEVEISDAVSTGAVEEQQCDSDQQMVEDKSILSEYDSLLNVESFTHEEYHSRKPRDMYASLYIKNNKDFSNIKEMPIVEFNDQWLNTNQVNFSDLFAQIEMRAILKIRIHFFSWVENGLVGPVLQNLQLFDEQISPKKAFQKDVLIENDGLVVVAQPSEEIIHSAEACEDVVSFEICDEPDETIINPQIKLTCILCQQSGEKRITGRLIPFQVNQFVHVNCAMWTSEVQEGTEETVVSSELYNFFFAFKHFRNNKCSICDLKGATLICVNHTVYRKCSAPFYHFPCAYASGKVSFQNTIEIFCPQCTKREKDVHAGLPIKFRDYHRRRVLIVKNLQPQCTTAFNNGAEIEPEIRTSAQQQYIVNCNKWRPFYYDMFNRVGNLTILSLCQVANQTIEMLHNISHQQTTWHERFKKRDVQEKHSDFASLRIFWKDGSTCEKGFYLFKENSVILISKPNVNQIIDYVQKFMKTRLSIGTQVLDVEPVQIDQFWSKQIQYLRQRYSNFCQDSTYLTPQLLCGLEKYPIQFWNNPMEKIGLKLQELKVVDFFYKQADRVIKNQQLYTQKSQLEPLISNEQPQPQTGLHSVFQTMLKANKYVNQDGLTREEAQNLKNPKFVSITPTENQIKQMLGSLDKTQSVFNQLSSRNISYEQVMGSLGKKTIKQRKLMRAAQTQIASDSEDEKMKVKVASISELEPSKQSSEIVVKGNEINLAMKYRAAKDRPKAVEVCTSKIHRNGLFACQQFNPKDIVIEYVGEKIRVPVADKREQYYEKLGVGDCYLFSLDNDYIIDATFYGNKARYINHSCDPNLKSDKLVVNGETHIIFMANRVIESGEELTFDYQFDYEAEKLECFCGSVKCQGRLN